VTAKLKIAGFKRVTEPIVEPVSKFGGQPVWLGSPQWPVSEGWGQPMMFIAQIALDIVPFDLEGPVMAYHFVTHPNGPRDDFFDPDVVFPDGGENALIIQPWSSSASMRTEEIDEGPSLVDPAGDPFEALPIYETGEDPAFLSHSDFSLLSDDRKRVYFTELDGNKIGGVPNFIQGDGWPESGYVWRLVLQLVPSSLPFFLRLGASPLLFSFVEPEAGLGRIVVQDS